MGLCDGVSVGTSVGYSDSVEFSVGTNDSDSAEGCSVVRFVVGCVSTQGVTAGGDTWEPEQLVLQNGFPGEEGVTEVPNDGCSEETQGKTVGVLDVLGVLPVEGDCVGDVGISVCDCVGAVGM